MGYYGLGPGMKVADKLSPLEQLLRSLPLERALAALEALEAMARNVVRQPLEESHRRLPLASPPLAPLASLPEGLELLRGMGWQVEGEDLVLPNSVRFDFQGHVVKIIEAKDFYKKERENARRSAKRTADFAKASASPQEVDRRAEASSPDRASITTLTGTAAAASPQSKCIVHQGILHGRPWFVTSSDRLENSSVDNAANGQMQSASSKYEVGYRSQMSWTLAKREAV